MGFLDSLLGRDSRKFIKRKDSDAGEAGEFLFSFLFFKSCWSIFFSLSSSIQKIRLIPCPFSSFFNSGIWGCVFPFSFPSYQLALCSSNPNSCILLDQSWKNNGLILAQLITRVCTFIDLHLGNS